MGPFKREIVEIKETDFFFKYFFFWGWGGGGERKK